MTAIKIKSGILSWSEDNVINASNDCGVFILRTSPTTDSIKIIEASENLNKDLVVRIADSSLSDIKFFDWYSMDTFDEAIELARSWNEKYIS